MKSPNRKTVDKLEDLPNVGKAVASHLRSIDINNPQELVGKDPFELYDALCIKKEKHIDPCIIDVFMAAVDYMEGAEPKPWWSYTPKRKQMMRSSD